MRKKLLAFLPFLLCCAIFAGCSSDRSTGTSSESFKIGSPTAEEILAGNPDADIFQFNGTVYTNASHIDWVQAEAFAAGEMVGTITKQYEDGLAFEDGMATKLPIGTEIYKPQSGGGILIAKTKEKEIRYLGLIEG